MKMTDPLTPGEMMVIEGLKDCIADRKSIGEDGLVAIMSMHVNACIDAGIIDNKPGTLMRCMVAAFGMLDTTQLKET